MADLDSLIGSKISLISQQEIKYDGTLFSINAAESSIVLRDVLCLGTEDRVTDSPVSAGTSVLPFVSFPGSEIKDLFVHEPTETPAPPVVERKSDPPHPPKNDNKQRDKPRHDKPRNDNRNGNRDNNRDSRQHNTAPRQPREQSGATPGMGDHLKNMRVRSDGNTDDKSAAAIKSQQDFDFQAALTNFDKVAIIEEVKNEKAAEGTTEAAIEPVAVKYVKDDFFDSLTSEKTARPSYKAERSLNQDTFGATSVQSNRRSGGRGGRGGRGRGRGQGRGFGSAAGRAYSAPA